MGLLIEEADWPLVIVAVPESGLPEDPRELWAWLDELLKRTDAWFDRGQKFAAIVDATHADRIPDARTRALLGDYRRRNRGRFSRLMVADATVVNSPLVRGVFTAVHWLGPSTNSQRFFSSREAALSWCRSCLTGCS